MAKPGRAYNGKGRYYMNRGATSESSGSGAYIGELGSVIAAAKNGGRNILKTPSPVMSISWWQWVVAKVKPRTGGAWVEKPVKVRIGASWVTKIAKVFQ